MTLLNKDHQLQEVGGSQSGSPNLRFVLLDWFKDMVICLHFCLFLVLQSTALILCWPSPKYFDVFMSCIDTPKLLSCIC